MKNQKIILALFALCLMPMAFAEVPVVDYSVDATDNSTAASVSTGDNSAAPIVSATPATQQSSSYNQVPSEQIVEGSANVPPVPDTSNMSTSQRLKRLEQQVNYLNNSQTNLDDLRQKLQKIQGDLEVEQHKSERLEKQLNDFYSDLDQRIGGTKAASPAGKTIVSEVKGDDSDLSMSSTVTSKSAAKKKGNATTSTKRTTDVTKADIDPSAVVDSSFIDSGSVAEAVNSVPKKTTHSASNAVSEQDTADDGAVTTTTTGKKNNAVNEQQAYQSAFDSLQNKQYDVAAKKLRAYLSNYPEGIYLGNAHYWLGEIYFQNKSYAKASTEFDIIVNKYANSSKAADAMFKLAYIHDKQGKHMQAQNEYKELKQRFPKSGAAKLADEQLSMNK